MGRKRKVPAGIQLRNWRDSFDESSDDENCTRLPAQYPCTTQSLLRQDLSPTPSGPPSTVSSVDRTSSPRSSSRHSSPQLQDPDTSDHSDEIVDHTSPRSSSRHSGHQLQNPDTSNHSDTSSSRHSGHQLQNLDTLDQDSEREEEPDQYVEDVIGDVGPDTIDEPDSDHDSMDSWEGDDEDNIEHDNEYTKLLQSIQEKWLLVELSHTVSKAATNAFWDLATTLFVPLLDLKNRLEIRRKIPKFVHVRRTLHKRYLPEIKHTTAYRDEFSKEIVEFTHPPTIIPTSQIKIYETASVKVIMSTRLNTSK